MRVSHSWMPKLNILEILTNFWPASEPCRQAPIKDMDFIFPVRTLPSPTCPPCKHEGMDMHSSSTVVCQHLGTISLKPGKLRVKMYYSEGGPSNGQISKRLMDTGLNPFRVDSNMIGPYTWAVTRSDLMRFSHSWTPQLNILEILKHFWPAS